MYTGDARDVEGDQLGWILDSGFTLGNDSEGMEKTADIICEVLTAVDRDALLVTMYELILAYEEITEKLDPWAEVSSPEALEELYRILSDPGLVGSAYSDLCDRADLAFKDWSLCASAGSLFIRVPLGCGQGHIRIYAMWARYESYFVETGEPDESGEGVGILAEIMVTTEEGWLALSDALSSVGRGISDLTEEDLLYEDFQGDKP